MEKEQSLVSGSGLQARCSGWSDIFEYLEWVLRACPLSLVTLSCSWDKREKEKEWVLNCSLRLKIPRSYFHFLIYEFQESWGHIREIETAIDTDKSEGVCKKEMMRKEKAFAVPNGETLDLAASDPQDCNSRFVILLILIQVRTNTWEWFHGFFQRKGEPFLLLWTQFYKCAGRGGYRDHSGVAHSEDHLHWKTSSPLWKSCCFQGGLQSNAQESWQGLKTEVQYEVERWVCLLWGQSLQLLKRDSLCCLCSCHVTRCSSLNSHWGKGPLFLSSSSKSSW